VATNKLLNTTKAMTAFMTHLRENKLKNSRLLSVILDSISELVHTEKNIIAPSCLYVRQTGNRQRKETALFAIDWLGGGVLVERETCILAAEDEAIAAAKTRAHDVGRRHPERQPDSFRLTDATGTILGIFPVRDWRR
jgi:hypothetical protein